MADKVTDSKYAIKKALRISQLGGNFKTLGSGPHACPILPAPRPLDPDYIPKHNPKIGNRAWESNPQMKHENPRFVGKFKGDYISKPMKKKDIPMVKYDHEKMNYHGWNA